MREGKNGETKRGELVRAVAQIEEPWSDGWTTGLSAPYTRVHRIHSLVLLFRVRLLLR